MRVLEQLGTEANGCVPLMRQRSRERKVSGAQIRTPENSPSPLLFQKSEAAASLRAFRLSPTNFTALSRRTTRLYRQTSCAGTVRCAAKGSLSAGALASSWDP